MFYLNNHLQRKWLFYARYWKVEEGWSTLFLDFMYRRCFLTFQHAEGLIYWNLTKNKPPGPPFRRQNRLLTSSFWSYLGLIYDLKSQLWDSPKGPGGCPKLDFDSLNILNTLVSSSQGLTPGLVFRHKFPLTVLWKKNSQWNHTLANFPILSLEKKLDSCFFKWTSHALGLMSTGWCLGFMYKDGENVRSLREQRLGDRVTTKIK